MCLPHGYGGNTILCYLSVTYHSISGIYKLLKTEYFSFYSLNVDCHRPISRSLKALKATEIEIGAGTDPSPGTQGEVAMTLQSNHLPEQSSRLNTFVVGAFMSAMIVLVGLLSFAPYSLI